VEQYFRPITLSSEQLGAFGVPKYRVEKFLFCSIFTARNFSWGCKPSNKCPLGDYALLEDFDMRKSKNCICISTIKTRLKKNEVKKKNKKKSNKLFF